MRVNGLVRIGGVLILVVGLAGCGGEPEPEPTSSAASTPSTVNEAAAPIEKAPVVEEEKQVEKTPATETTKTAEAKPKVILKSSGDGVTGLKKAKAGDGVKGSGYGGGIITEPVSVYFKARQKITYDVQIPHGLKNFRALHDRYPKDLKEFTEQILKPARIKLPELPAGRVYVYDPKKGELLVGREESK